MPLCFQLPDASVLSLAGSGLTWLASQLDPLPAVSSQLPVFARSVTTQRSFSKFVLPSLSAVNSWPSLFTFWGLIPFFVPLLSLEDFGDRAAAGDRIPTASVTGSRVRFLSGAGFCQRTAP